MSACDRDGFGWNVVDGGVPSGHSSDGWRLADGGQSSPCSVAGGLGAGDGSCVFGSLPSRNGGERGGGGVRDDGRRGEDDADPLRHPCHPSAGV